MKLEEVDRKLRHKYVAHICMTKIPDAAKENQPFYLLDKVYLGKEKLDKVVWIRVTKSIRKIEAIEGDTIVFNARCDGKTLKRLTKIERINANEKE